MKSLDTKSATISMSFDMYPLISIYSKAVFEFDDSVDERSVHVPGLSGYYGQGQTKTKAFAELVEGFLDTYQY